MSVLTLREYKSAISWVLHTHMKVAAFLILKSFVSDGRKFVFIIFYYVQVFFKEPYNSTKSLLIVPHNASHHFIFFVVSKYFFRTLKIKTSFSPKNHTNLPNQKNVLFRIGKYFHFLTNPFSNITLIKQSIHVVQC